MHGEGIAGALWSAVRRLASAPGGIRATIAAVAIFAGAAPRASADVQYDFLGTSYVNNVGPWTTSNHVTGDVVFANPLPPDASIPVTAIQSYSFTDGIVTVSGSGNIPISNSNTSGLSSFSGPFFTDSSGNIVQANLTAFGGGVSSVSVAGLPSDYSGITITPHGDNSLIGSSSCCNISDGSVGGGTWSGPMAVSTTPTISVTATIGKPLSTDGGKTHIVVTATPTGGLTLARAATALGYPLGLDWVQMLTAPSPIPAQLYQATNPPTALSGTFNDPPKYGYVNGVGAGNYPFVYNPADLNVLEYCNDKAVPGGPCLQYLPIETSTSLSLSDSPADPCLPGGSAVLCGTTPATSGKLEFMDELVGVIQCNTPDVGSCNSAGLGPSAPISFLYNGQSVTSIAWTDTFNGTSGGIPAFDNLNLVDPGSGSGGIVLGDTSVPEPPTSTLIIVPVMLSIMLSYRVKKRRGTA